MGPASPVTWIYQSEGKHWLVPTARRAKLKFFTFTHIPSVPVIRHDCIAIGVRISLESRQKRIKIKTTVGIYHRSFFILSNFDKLIIIFCN